ncbi:DUF551 domain-containing protein [Escherichia coli]|nr:DUF551 domain-containing protein [Escherichia coli]
MSKIDYQALREAAEKATPGRVGDRIDGSGSIKYECHGYDGSLVLRTDHKNMEYGFIGDNGNADELFFRLCVPDVVLALLDELETAKKCIAELEAEPVSQAYNLPELIEGMEVSIDVSTCDADLGNRYFGTVTEASELDTAKNGYILLVQDVEPNFDINGNSPGTPDSWISCSERMPEKNQNVLISVNFDSSLVEPLICSARYTGSTFRRGDATIKPGNGIEQATHWMPLPEPPQEVNRG